MHRFAVCFLLSAGLAAGACSNDLVTTPTTTTTQTPTADTFTGTLTRNGAASFPFASGPGTVQATLTTLAPDGTLLVGFSLGTWNGTACQIVLAVDNATQGTVVIGSATASGNLCVRIYDVGNIVQPPSYQIDVVHL